MTESLFTSVYCTLNLSVGVCNTLLICCCFCNT